MISSPEESGPPKVTAAFVDGRDVGGFLLDFVPVNTKCSLASTNDPSGGEPQEIDLREVKALFFVREFGEIGRYDSDGFPEDAPGRKLEVIFNDGDRLVGTTYSFEPSRQGFFVLPADTAGNILRVFVIHKNVRQVRRFLPGARRRGDGSAELRRSPRHALEVPLTATWTDERGRFQTETVTTTEVNDHGALIALEKPVMPGFEIKLTNMNTEETASVQVVNVRIPSREKTLKVGLELARPDPRFWSGSERP